MVGGLLLSAHVERRVISHMWEFYKICFLSNTFLTPTSKLWLWGYHGFNDSGDSCPLGIRVAHVLLPHHSYTGINTHLLNLTPSLPSHTMFLLPLLLPMALAGEAPRLLDQFATGHSQLTRRKKRAPMVWRNQTYFLKNVSDFPSILSFSRTKHKYTKKILCWYGMNYWNIIETSWKYHSKVVLRIELVSLFWWNYWISQFTAIKN